MSNFKNTSTKTTFGGVKAAKVNFQVPGSGWAGKFHT